MNSGHSTELSSIAPDAWSEEPGCLPIADLQRRMTWFNVPAVSSSSGADALSAIECALAGKTTVFFADAPMRCKRATTSVAATHLLDHLHRGSQACINDLEELVSSMQGYLAEILDTAQYDPLYAGSFQQFASFVTQGRLDGNDWIAAWRQSDLDEQGQQRALRAYFRHQQKLQQEIFDDSGSFFRILSMLGPWLEYLRFVKSMSRHGLERQLLFRDLISSHVVLENSPEVQRSLRTGGAYQPLGGAVQNFLQTGVFQSRDNASWDARSTHAWESDRTEDLTRIFPWKASEANWLVDQGQGKFLSWPLLMTLPALRELPHFGSAYLNLVAFSNALLAQANWLQSRLDYVAGHREQREREVGGSSMSFGSRENSVQEFIHEIQRCQCHLASVAAMLASLIVVPQVQRCRYCYRRTAHTPKGARKQFCCEVHRQIDTHAHKADGQVSNKTRMRHAAKISLAYLATLHSLIGKVSQDLGSGAEGKLFGILHVPMLCDPTFSINQRRDSLLATLEQLSSCLGMSGTSRLHSLMNFLREEFEACAATVEADENSDALEQHIVFWKKVFQLPSFFHMYFCGVSRSGSAFSSVPFGLSEPIDSQHSSAHWMLEEPDQIPPWVYLDYIQCVTPRTASLTHGDRQQATQLLPPLLEDILSYEAWIRTQGITTDELLNTPGKPLIEPRRRRLTAYQDRIVTLRNTLVPNKSGGQVQMSFAKIADRIRKESGGSVNVSKAAIQQEYEIACQHPSRASRKRLSRKSH